MPEGGRRRQGSSDTFLGGGGGASEVLNLVNLGGENGEGGTCRVAGGVVSANREAEGGKSDKVRHRSWKLSMEAELWRDDYSVKWPDLGN